MKEYVLPEWIKQYEQDAKPFPIEEIKLKKYEEDWTLFFYSKNDTTGGLIINKASKEEINDLLNYAEYKHLPITYESEKVKNTNLKTKTMEEDVERDELLAWDSFTCK